MLPISEIPAAIFQFASRFGGVFNHPAQEKHFAEYLTGLIASGNRTVAGIHQGLISDTEYDSLHHFMTESPWSADMWSWEHGLWTRGLGEANCVVLGERL